MSENRFALYIKELKQSHLDTRLRCIEDHTSRGEFCTYDNKAGNIRVEVDSRFISDIEVIDLLNKVMINVYNKTKRTHSLNQQT